MIYCWFLSLIACLVKGDSYLHNPPGSNNHLSEQSNTVQNQNRLFNSQNNAQHGYGRGDACIPNCGLDQPVGSNVYNYSYPGAGNGTLQYYEGSWLYVEWTSQHGSNINRLNNNYVLQYMCDDGPATSPFSAGLRDGYNPDVNPTIPFNKSAPGYQTYGQHETYEWYANCQNRTRNKGLYVADQNLNGATAQFTRQNSNGNRYGFECPEERDYYPYCQASNCPMYQASSQNVRNYGSCSNNTLNNLKDCQFYSGIWSEAGSWNQPPPNCTVASASRNNHNGNEAGTGQPPHYNWQIPTGIHADGANCVLRLRYNISTKDFPGGDDWNVFSASNGPNSPVKTNPASDFVGLGQGVSGPIRLNINTAQFGRVFQDRTHVFQIRNRPDNIGGTFKSSASINIVNFNVRGRRGNIQQTYPSVEYDFVPPSPQLSTGDYLHIQWHGTDSSDQGNDGNGRTGTDRSNLVIIPSPGSNTPVTINNISPTNSSPLHFSNNMVLVAQMAFLNQTNCDVNTAQQNDPANCKQMNAAPGYFNVGLVKMDNPGTFHVISTRNSAFSNRDQKETITVAQDWVSIVAGLAIAVGSVGLLAAMGMLSFRYAKKNPSSVIAGVYKRVAPKTFEHGVEEDEDDENQTKPTILDKYPLLAGPLEYWAWNQPQIVFYVFFGCANLGAWLYGYFINLNISPAPYFPLAKGFGKMLDFNLNFLLFPVLKNFISWLRTTAAAEKLPLDDAIKIHKFTAYTLAAASFGHILFHFMDFAYMQSNFAYPVSLSVFGNISGITGLLMTGCVLAMFSTAFLKRKIYSIFGHRFDGYRTFLTVHKLYIPIFVLLWLHGAQAWQFSIFPVMFLMLEKFIQSRRTKLDVHVVEAKMVGRDVLALKMILTSKGKSRFRYKAGQYLFLCCPEISENEFHPFTITSAPEENFFSCHIRCRKDMDWTYKLRELLGLGENKGELGPLTPNILSTKDVDGNEVASELFSMRVDGPYGSASEEVFDYETVVLVGAGIGVTPFISILKSFAIRMQSGQDADILTIYFYWICRDQAEFDSFSDFFNEILKIKELSSHIEMNLYVTGEMNLKDVTRQAYNQYSGRPNWNRIFNDKKIKHEGTEVGVFLRYETNE